MKNFPYLQYGSPKLLSGLKSEALPIWASVCLDIVRGGFHERLEALRFGASVVTTTVSSQRTSGATNILRSAISPKIFANRIVHPLNVMDLRQKRALSRLKFVRRYSYRSVVEFYGR